MIINRSLNFAILNSDCKKIISLSLSFSFPCARAGTHTHFLLCAQVNQSAEREKWGYPGRERETAEIPKGGRQRARLQWIWRAFHFRPSSLWCLTSLPLIGSLYLFNIFPFLLKIIWVGFGKQQMITDYNRNILQNKGWLRKLKRNPKTHVLIHVLQEKPRE